jgi:N-acetyl-gamma-glutamyl-phosphate reductase
MRQGSNVTITAAVAGASGYAGGELLRLLLDHPGISIGPVTAETKAGESVTSVHPHLVPLGDRRFSATDVDSLSQADLVFLALPHGESGPLAAALPADLPIVDLGADHRLVDAGSWTQYYGGAHAGTWLYGLPELPGVREALASAHRVANPGCYPTGVILGLTPLLAADLVEPDDIVIVAASGTTGAGRAAKESLMASEVMGSFGTYKAGGVHQHTPEIEQALSAAAGSGATISFTPTLAPMPRGILATSTARLREGVTTEELQEALHNVYAHEPFVHLLAQGQWPNTGAVLGSNSVHLQVVADRHAGRALVTSAIDNLTKGAAGQALQNANLMLGLHEAQGLPSVGVAP